MHKVPFELTQEALFAHDAEHPLVVDDPARSLERMGEAPIAIAWKVQDDALTRIKQLDISLSSLWSRLFLIVPGMTDLQELTELTDRTLGHGLMHLGDHRVSLLDLTWRKAFFTTVFSQANCPSAAL
jgi:hypothetical protein